MVEPLALRPRPAADALGISERHLRALVARGEIHAAKLGRCTVFSVDELKRFLATSMKSATTQTTTT